MLRHIPVLAQEIYDYIPDNRTRSFDGTFGHGGHAQFFLSSESKKRPIESLKIIGTDIDTAMIAKAQSLTADFKNNISIIHSSYANIDKIAKEL